MFNDDDFRPDVFQMWPGDAVAYLIGKRIATVGTITFVGGNGHQIACGNVTVGENKILFQIEEKKLSALNLLSNALYSQKIFLIL